MTAVKFKEYSLWCVYTRSSVKVALKVTLEEKGNISGPKKLEVFGASYLYSMFLRFGLIDTERKLNGYLPDMDNI